MEPIMAEEHKPAQKEIRKTQPLGFWIALGAAIGLGIGLASDNMALAGIFVMVFTVAGLKLNQKSN